MKPNPKTLTLVALATGMLVSAYLIGPAPATTAGVASMPRPTQTASAAAPVPSAPPTTSIKAVRAPVPLSVASHKEFFAAQPADSASSSAPNQMMDITAKTVAMDEPSSPTEMMAAKSAIETDGYRKVSSLVKGPDGSWRGRAMRGATEISVRVSADGSVAAD